MVIETCDAMALFLCCLGISLSSGPVASPEGGCRGWMHVVHGFGFSWVDNIGSGLTAQGL